MGYNDYEHKEIEGGEGHGHEEEEDHDEDEEDHEEHGEEGTTFRNEDAWDGRLELVHKQVGNWRGALGFQAGEQLFSAVGEEALIPKTDIQKHAVYLIERADFEKASLELGLRFEEQNMDAVDRSNINHDMLSYSAGVSVPFREKHTFGFIASHSERAPTVEELFSNGEHHATESFDVGDASLDEESSNSIEAYWHYSGSFDFEVNLYRNDFDDFIYQRNTGMDDEETGLHIFNYEDSDAEFKGFEIVFGKTLCECGSGDLGLQLFVDGVDAELSGGENVPRLPPHRIGAELTYATERWFTSFDVVDFADQNDSGENEEDTDGYLMLNAFVEYTIPRSRYSASVFLRGENLLDEEVRNSTSFLREIQPESGLTFEIGFRFLF
jgi:iron complex outermembrane receptor protein